MKARAAIGFIAVMFVLSLTAHAGSNDGLKTYFNDAAKKIKATDNAAEKRTILNESFQSMSEALDIVKRSPSISKNDIAGIDRFKAALREKQDELAGSNGFQRVADDQLNTFSDYVVQDMEQADEMISISLVTLLLIIILVVLIT